MTFEDVPEPFKGQLSVFVIGPGFGESQVISLPDGRWVVVDSCRVGGSSAPLALLRRFGVEKVDLLVVTHPDLDHISGIAELIQNVAVERVWRFPQWALLSPLIARWLRKNDGDRRLSELSRTMEALEVFFEGNRGSEVVWGHRAWPMGGADYAIHALAPTGHDANAANKRLRAALTGNDGPEIPSWITSFLEREGRRAPEDSNGVSLALTVEWNGVKILLGGDVHNGSNNPNSGWSGVLRSLEEANELHLVTDLAMVKVAHHGSSFAFWHQAWGLHSATEKVALGALTPFNRGTNPPPHLDTLESLGWHVETLAVTSLAGSQETINAAGWEDDGQVSGPGEVGLIASSFDRDGTITVYRDGVARTFSRTTVDDEPQDVNDTSCAPEE